MDAAVAEPVRVTDASTSNLGEDNRKSILIDDNPLDSSLFKHPVAAYQVMVEQSNTRA